jgi:hypothetical protein
MAMGFFMGGNRKKFQMTIKFFPSSHKKFFGCNQKFLVAKLMAEIEHCQSKN